MWTPVLASMVSMARAGPPKAKAALSLFFSARCCLPWLSVQAGILTRESPGQTDHGHLVSLLGQVHQDHRVRATSGAVGGAPRSHVELADLLLGETFAVVRAYEQDGLCGVVDPPATTSDTDVDLVQAPVDLVQRQPAAAADDEHQRGRDPSGHHGQAPGPGRRRSAVAARVELGRQRRSAGDVSHRHPGFDAYRNRGSGPCRLRRTGRPIGAPLRVGVRKVTSRLTRLPRPEGRTRRG